ncbi:hypothetical protein [Streptomyces kaniharaensis]|uniref:hypothetical protein n=1 Tax=Streptomyces kaniharaensis TaxID=212423 RepID=UPI00129642C0|nr:hypothetical protein [Streptomyces kaniharaensis]
MASVAGAVLLGEGLGGAGEFADARVFDRFGAEEPSVYASSASRALRRVSHHVLTL